MVQLIAFLILAAGPLLSTAASAQAPSPRKQLKLLVEQLQSAPDDDDLRRKIIKLARDVKPLPAVPDAAIEAEGRGKFLFKTAESAQDYLPAAKEYERATDAAPWVLGYYSDLCMVDEKAKKYAEAKRACELYLLGLTDQDMIADTKSRIAGLKLGIEKIAAAGDAAKGKPQFAGTWNLCQDGQPNSCFAVRLSENTGAWKATRGDGFENYLFHAAITGRRLELDQGSDTRWSLDLSDDNRKLIGFGLWDDRTRVNVTATRCEDSPRQNRACDESRNCRHEGERYQCD